MMGLNYDYIASGDTIIFDPEYNKPLLGSSLGPSPIQVVKAQTQTQYKKIIFSNHELNERLFEAWTNNKWKKWDEYIWYIFDDNFTPLKI